MSNSYFVLFQAAPFKFYSHLLIIPLKVQRERLLFSVAGGFIFLFDSHLDFQAAINCFCNTSSHFESAVNWFK